MRSHCLSAEKLNLHSGLYLGSVTTISYLRENNPLQLLEPHWNHTFRNMEGICQLNGPRWRLSTQEARLIKVHVAVLTPPKQMTAPHLSLSCLAISLHYGLVDELRYRATVPLLVSPEDGWSPCPAAGSISFLLRPRRKGRSLSTPASVPWLFVSGIYSLIRGWLTLCS